MGGHIPIGASRAARDFGVAALLGASRAAGVIVVAAMFGLCMWARTATASQLLVPSIGVPDTGMAGATVATPLTPTAAAFSNPAGITAMEPGSMSVSFGLPVGHTRMHAS